MVTVTPPVNKVSFLIYARDGYLIASRRASTASEALRLAKKTWGSMAHRAVRRPKNWPPSASPT